MRRSIATVFIVALIACWLSVGYVDATVFAVKETKRVRPDAVLKINLSNSGYMDQVIPFSVKQDGFFIVASGPNQIHKVDSSYQVESYMVQTAFNQKLMSMGVLERCVGGLLTSQYSSLNLVYSGDGKLGKSYIIQFNTKNLSKIEEVFSLGSDSHVVEVLPNHELGLLHLLLRRNDQIYLVTFDPSDNSSREQLFPMLTAGKMTFNRKTGLIVAVGNSTSSSLLNVDPNTLKIKSTYDLDSRGIFEINSLDISDSLKLSIVYSKYTTVMYMFAYDQQLQKFEPIQELAFSIYKRFDRCEIIQDSLICVNGNVELVSFPIKEYNPRYFPLDSSENNLSKSFKQVDEEDQLLLFVPQTYVTDDDTFRVSVFNFNKFK